MTVSERRGAPAPGSLAELRLIRAARDGDRGAQARLLVRYEPLVQAIVRACHPVGGEPEDLAQHARLGS